MTTLFAPMLAATVKDADELQYPLLGSPKLDGVRAIVLGAVVYSRKLLPIPNRYVQALYGKAMYNGMDGELILGSPTAPDVYRKTSSYVMTKDGVAKEAITFCVFDDFSEPGDAFYLRLANLRKRIGTQRRKAAGGSIVAYVEQRDICSSADLLRYEDSCLTLGYEGVMLRNPQGTYKNGRSTLNEGFLMKMKRFQDAEAVIIGVEELTHNTNVAKTDYLGKSKRSSHKAGMVGGRTLGALLVKGEGAATFSIGSGFDQATRDSLWKQRKRIIGQTVKYKFFAGGSKDRPRFPVFLGMRSAADL